MSAAYDAYTDGIRASGQFLGGEALQDVSSATTVSVRDGRAVVTDGPVRRDEGAPRRLLPDRRARPRRGDRGRGAHPRRTARRIEVRPIREFGADRPRVAGDTVRDDAARASTRLPRGARPGARDAHPGPGATSTSPRRPWRMPTSWRSERWPAGGIPANAGRLDHDHRAQPGDRPGPAGAQVRREGARPWPATPRSTRSRARRRSRPRRRTRCTPSPTTSCG